MTTEAKTPREEAEARSQAIDARLADIAWEIEELEDESRALEREQTQLWEKFPALPVVWPGAAPREDWSTDGAMPARRNPSGSCLKTVKTE